MIKQKEPKGDYAGEMEDDSILNDPADEPWAAEIRRRMGLEPSTEATKSAKETIKEKFVSLKHEPGQHPQKAHGNRGFSMRTRRHMDAKKLRSIFPYYPGFEDTDSVEENQRRNLGDLIQRGLAAIDSTEYEGPTKYFPTMAGRKLMDELG